MHDYPLTAEALGTFNQEKICIGTAGKINIIVFIGTAG